MVEGKVAFGVARTEHLLFAMRAVRHAASRVAGSRFASLLLEVDAGLPQETTKARFVAADNARIAIAGFDVFEAQPGQVLLPLAQYPLVRAFLHHYRVRGLWVEADAKRLRFAVAGSAAEITVVPAAGHFPEYREALSKVKSGQGVRMTALNPEFLGQPADIPFAPLVVMVAGPDQPLLLARHRYREIIMPLLVGADAEGEEP